MAGDRTPMTEAEIQTLRERMEAQRADVRAALAEELGGDPEDYRADRFVADGGDA